MTTEEINNIARNVLIALGVDVGSRNVGLVEQAILSAVEKTAEEICYSRKCLISRPMEKICKDAIGFQRIRDKSLIEQLVATRDRIEDYLVDEFGRPPGWCEVCWRGYLFEYQQESH